MILDEKIFEGLYYKYSDRLYNFAFRFVSDEHTAQDIVHEANSTLWEKFEGKESDTWQALLFRIVRNRSIDTLRRQSSLRIVSLTDSLKNVCDEYLYQMDFAVNDSDRKTIYDELTANIHSIMNKLPDRCREVFMKNREIAAELGISEKAVEKHIHKALTVFRKELDDLASGGNTDLQGSTVHLWLLFILTCMVD